MTQYINLFKILEYFEFPCIFFDNSSKHCSQKLWDFFLKNAIIFSWWLTCIRTLINFIQNHPVKKSWHPPFIYFIHLFVVQNHYQQRNLNIYREINWMEKHGRRNTKWPPKHLFRAILPPPSPNWHPTLIQDIPANMLKTENLCHGCFFYRVVALKSFNIINHSQLTSFIMSFTFTFN